MSLYQVKADVENYQWLTVTNQDDWDVEDMFDGSSIQQSWKPVVVEPLIDDEGDTDLPLSDFPQLFYRALVFSERAANILESILTTNGEILRLKCKHGNYVVFNVTQISDALSTERSDIVYFSDGGVLDIRYFVFDAQRLSNNDIFKIHQIPTAFFVSEKFKDTAEKHSLSGFVFKEVEVIT